MELLYWLISFLPVDWAAPGHLLFMKHAFLAVLLIAPLYGLLGTLVVNNRMAFFSDALGHGAFTGIAIGSLLGFALPAVSALVFSVLFSVVITLVKYRSKLASDTIIGVFSSAAIALGIFLGTLDGRNFNKLTGFLIGDLLSIRPAEIAQLVLVLAAVLLLWVLLYNPMQMVSINASLAGSRGIRPMTMEMIFTAAIACVVTLTMGWIGLLVINAFMVLPAAAARNISGNTRQFHLFTMAFAWFSGIVGLQISYELGTATGSTIVLVATVIFAVCSVKGVSEWIVRLFSKHA